MFLLKVFSNVGKKCRYSARNLEMDIYNNVGLHQCLSKGKNVSTDLPMNHVNCWEY